MEIYRSQVITAILKWNKINKVKKPYIEIHLEFILHYITLTSYYIVMGIFRTRIIRVT